MASEPTVTVLINAFRRVEFLDQAIRSVVTQESRLGFEVILTIARRDYVPAADVREIIRARSIPFRLIPLTNEPVGCAIARGCQEASGDIVALIDDDDTWQQGKIARIEAAFADHPQIGLYHDAQEFNDEKGRPISPSKLHWLRHPYSLLPPGRQIIGDAWDPDLFQRIVAYGAAFCNSSFALSKSLLRSAAAHLSKVRVGEDNSLFLLGAARGRHVYITTDRLTNFRIHGFNTTSAGVGTDYPAARLAYLKLIAEPRLSHHQLLRELLPAGCPRHFVTYIDRYHMEWVSLFQIASGQENGEVRETIRSLINSETIHPGSGDLIRAGMLCASKLAPRTVSKLFLATRTRR